MRNRATAVFRRLPSGDVIGEIIAETGEVIQSRNFGKMSEDEYRKILDLIDRERPDMGAIEPIELSGN